MKEQILRAAQRLIRAGTVASRIRATDLVAAGACTDEEFARHFPDSHVFQRELCAQLFADARSAIIDATTAMQSGIGQMSTAFITYLDYNIDHPALQELAHHIQFTPEGSELLQRMELGVALVIQADLEAMGATLRAARARLLTALAVAVVRAEYQSRRKLPEMRDALLDYCRLSGASA